MQGKRTKKIKILAVGDIHGDTSMTQRLADKVRAEKVDVVILSGDITFAESSTQNIIGPFVKAGAEVLVIPGNHESIATVDFLAEMYPSTVNLHGYSIRKGELGIFGAGSGNVGIFQLKESEIFDLLKKGNQGIKGAKKKIMVTHMHPSGTIMEKMTQMLPASSAVRRAIEEFKPDIAICSHSHESAGLEDKIGKTRVINVSRKEKIFEI